MPSSGSALAIAFVALSGMTMNLPAALAQDNAIIDASEIGARPVVIPGAGDRSRRGVDRTVISPFQTERRIVVRPAAEAAAGVSSTDTGAGVATPVATSEYIDIGDLDRPAVQTTRIPEAVPTGSVAAGATGLYGTPCTTDCPDQQVEFFDIRPYYGTPAPAISLPRSATE